MNKNSIKARQLAAYLKQNCLGWDHLTDGSKLAKILNVKRSNLNKLVSCLRRNEVPIAGSGDGYCYADNAEEIVDTILFLEHYKAGIELTIAGLKRGLKHFGRKP